MCLTHLERSSATSAVPDTIRSSPRVSRTVQRARRSPPASTVISSTSPLATTVSPANTRAWNETVSRRIEPSPAHAISMLATYARLSGPWFTGRSPWPAARTASTSQWIGYGSRSSAAMVFMRSTPTSTTATVRSAGSAVPAAGHRRNRQRLVTRATTAPSGSISSIENVTSSWVTAPLSSRWRSAATMPPSPRQRHVLAQRLRGTPSRSRAASPTRGRHRRPARRSRRSTCRRLDRHVEQRDRVQQPVGHRRPLRAVGQQPVLPVLDGALAAAESMADERGDRVVGRWRGAHGHQATSGGGYRVAYRATQLGIGSIGRRAAGRCVGERRTHRRAAPRTPAAARRSGRASARRGRGGGRSPGGR